VAVGSKLSIGYKPTEQPQDSACVQSNYVSADRKFLAVSQSTGFSAQANFADDLACGVV
jgi:hypothetical protein